MFSYAATATFQGSKHQPCRHMTSECPDRCGHATRVYEFQLNVLHITAAPDSKNAQWVTPKKEGDVHCIAENTMGAWLPAAQELSPGDQCALEWSHDYVTMNGCSGPQYPVLKLAKC